MPDKFSDSVSPPQDLTSEDKAHEDEAPFNALASHAEAIRHIGKRVITDVIEIGRRLVDCRDNHLNHGQWLPWLEQEFGWTEQSALNYIRVFEGSKSKNFLDLNLPVSTLYLLFAPSTPESAVDEVIERAEAGETMSPPAVKQIVEDAKDAEVDGEARPARKGWSRERLRRHKEKKRDQVKERVTFRVSVMHAALEEMDREILELTEPAATGGGDEMAAHKADDVVEEPGDAKPSDAPKKRSMAQAIREQTAGADMYVAAKKLWHKMPLPDQERLLSYLAAGAYEGVWYAIKSRASVAEQVGPNSSGEAARLQAQVDELENEVRRRDIKIAGLESEVAELKAEAARPAAECPDVKAAAQIVEVHFDQFIRLMSPTLRARLERKVRHLKIGGDGDVDPNRPIARMLHGAIKREVTAADPHTSEAVANGNRLESQRLLRDVDRKVRSMGFVIDNMVHGIDPAATPRRTPTVSVADADAASVGQDPATTIADTTGH